MGQGRHTLRSINDPVYPVARSASAVIPIAKKVQLTLIRSPLRAFQ